MPLDSRAALDLAVTAFRKNLAFVSANDWAAPTPCPGWDVQYLVAHVVGGNRFAAEVLDGHTAEHAMTAVMGTPQLGVDPVADFDSGVSAQQAGFARDGALDHMVSHPLGDIPGQRFLDMRIFDIAVHSCDLAIAIGRDATLESDLIETVLTIIRGEVPGMGFGIQPLGLVDPTAAPMDILLDLAGRTPRSAELS